MRAVHRQRPYLISEGPVFQSQVADFDTLLSSQGVIHTPLELLDHRRP